MESSKPDTAQPQELVALNVDRAVHERYAQAAQQREQQLCCPVDYDNRYLETLPAELIERDYGCGDPSRHVAAGETVLDLGSGGGKICYIAAQIVGSEGQVIGVDCNDEMLNLARRFQPEIAERIGYDCVRFHKGRIQDLALDLDVFQQYLAEHPIRTSSDWLAAQAHADELRHTAPMIADDSVDVVVSNCVLNLVRREDRRQMFQEIHRVLRRGGRAVISDIVSDEPVPQHLQRDPRLWSGCISGSYLEHELLAAFEEAGFYGVEILERQAEPWAEVEGIEFRSLTVRAWKGKAGPCLERRQAVIYKGPWKSVTDDDGHTLRRGQRMAVCDKTFHIYTTAPYAAQVEAVPPALEVPLEKAQEFDCRANAVRDPRETKQERPALTQLPLSDCCGPDECC